MNNKIAIGAFVLVTLALVVGVGYFFVRILNTSDTPTPTITDPFGQGGLQGTATTTSDRIVIRAANGQAFAVPDFTQGHEVVKQDSGTYYYLTNDAAGNEQEEDFSIVYGTDSSISIGLFAEPLGETRIRAEKALRTHIPLSNAQFCTMDVSVMTVPDVNEQYAAVDLGLSFCPNAVKLPQ